MIPIPRIGLRTAIEIAIGALLLLALAIQTVRIDGLLVWPLRVTGLEQKLDDANTRAAGAQLALDRTVANYRAAAIEAASDDAANAERVKSEAAAVNERTIDDYQARLADADSRYDRMRSAAAAAAADSGGGAAAAVPGAGADRPQAAGAANQDGLPDVFSLDDRHIATREAIQLDELIKAVKAVQAIDPNKPAQPGSQPSVARPSTPTGAESSVGNYIDDSRN